MPVVTRALIEVPVEVRDLILELGLDRSWALLDEARRGIVDRRLRGSFTKAGLALPETVTQWAGGPVDVLVDDDGCITVVKNGGMPLLVRAVSRQGVLQKGWLRERMLAVGYRPKDKIDFRHDATRDEFVGERYRPLLTAVEMMAEGVTTPLFK